MATSIYSMGNTAPRKLLYNGIQKSLTSDLWARRARLIPPRFLLIGRQLRHRHQGSPQRRRATAAVERRKPAFRVDLLQAVPSMAVVA